MNEKECSRSVPIRNVPLHRKQSHPASYGGPCFKEQCLTGNRLSPIPIDYHHFPQ